MFRSLLLLALLAVAGPLAAAPALEEYGKLPAVEAMDLSPSGDHIAYVAVTGDARALVVQDLAGKTLVAVGVGDRKVREAFWLDDRHVLVSLSTTVSLDPAAWVSKGEFMQSVIINIAGGKPIVVFGNETKILHTTYGYFGAARADGRDYAYFGGETLRGSGDSFVDFSNGQNLGVTGFVDLYRVDLDTGHPELVAGGSALTGSDWVVDAQGRIVADARYDPRAGRWALYQGAGALTPIQVSDDPAGDVELEGEGRVAGSVLVREPGAHGDWSLVEIPAGGGGETELAGGATFKRLVRDPVTRLLVGGVVDSDTPRTVLFDPALQAKFDKVTRAFPGAAVELQAAADDLSRMIVETSGPGDSGTYYLIDLGAGTAHAIGWAYPKILQGDVGPVSVVRYKAADGLDEEGVLTLPPGRPARRLPLVVLAHGGPQERDYAEFDWWAQAYASLGYAVFQPNFRGSDGFGKAFRDAGFGQWGRKMQTDISDGLDELAREGIVDPRRACIVGASYGGYAALAGVTMQQGLYRCAVSVGGISDLAALNTRIAETAGTSSAALRYQKLFEGEGDLAERSPDKLAGRADAPVLLVWGKDDTVVPPAQSLAMRDALRAADKPVETLALPHEDHWLSQTATRTQMLTVTATFIERHDPPN